MSEKRARYFSPQKKEKISNINTHRELNKTSDKRKMLKFKTNNNVFKTKKYTPINDIDINKSSKKSKMFLSERNKNKNKLDKKENQEEGNTKTGEETKNNKIEQIKDNNEENNEKSNLIKHREKKVHYERKRDKYIKYNKKNPKLSSKIKYKNDLKTSFNGFQTTKNENQKNRIKSAMIDDSDKKKVIKEKNDYLKKSANFEMINNSRKKSKNNINFNPCLQMTFISSL